jgi:hypothetical protein
LGREMRGCFCFNAFDMKPEAYLFGLVALAPLIAFILFRSTAARTIASMGMAVLFMSVCIAVGEARSRQPDYDITFGIAMIVWDVIAVIYAMVLSFIIGGIKEFFGSGNSQERANED